MFRLIAVLLTLSCQIPLAAQVQNILEINAPDVAAMKATFTSHPVGNIVMGEDLSALRQFIMQEIEREAPMLKIIIENATAVHLKLEASGDKNNPVGLYLLLKGDFSGITPAAAQQLKQKIQIPGAEIAVTAQQITLAKQHSGDTTFQNVQTGTDIQINWNTEALKVIAEESAKAREKAQVKAMMSFIPDGHIGVQVTAEQISNYMQLNSVPAGLKAVDLNMLKRLPATENQGMMALGINGKSWWDAHKDAVVTVMAENMFRDSSEDAKVRALTQVNAMATMFLGTDLESFINAIDGTVMLVFNEPIFTYPNVSFLIPRSTGLDMLITRICAMGQQRVPESGQFEFVSFVNPSDASTITAGAICIGCDDQHWVISMDSQFTEAYISGQQHDISTRRFAKKLAHNPEEICLLTVMSPNQGMLVALEHAAGGLANVFANGRFGRDLAMASHKIVKHMEPVTSIGRMQGGKLIVRNEGAAVFMPGNVAVVAIIAAIAIPNLLESRITANEAAAGATLKSAFFSSLVQFQAGGYQDADANGVGEYGFIEWLNGEAACLGAAKGDIQFLIGNDFRTGKNGYRYEIWLPDGPNKARNFEDGPSKSPEGIRMSETMFLVYAWPDKANETGRRAFAMMQDGQLRSIPAAELNGEAPAWNAVFGGGDNGWKDNPTWNFYMR